MNLGLDVHIISIISTEKAYHLAEKYNCLIFRVQRNINKKQIKELIEKLYNVKVVKVNTLIDREGYKRAYVKLSIEYNALDILDRLSR